MFAFVEGSPVFLRTPGRAEVAAVLQGLGYPGPRGKTLGSWPHWTVATISPRRSLLGHLICPCLPLY